MSTGDEFDRKEFAHSEPPVRGTQSFVYTLSACWKRPSLSLIEIAWRWLFGVPAGWLIANETARSLHGVPVDYDVWSRVSIFEPAASLVALSRLFTAIQMPLIHLAVWLAPLLLVAWGIFASIGRTTLLSRADPVLYSRPFTLMLLQCTRMAALVATLAAWFLCLCWAMHGAVSVPIANGLEPNLVLFCALTILATLGLFTLWLIVSWIFWVSPLVAMLRDQGAIESLGTALHLGLLKAKLVEINLVMGIVKIALIVLAIVMSSCPLPFESVATPDFMRHWYEFTVVVYFAASDFFNVVRIMAYLQLWRTYETAPRAA